MEKSLLELLSEEDNIVSNVNNYESTFNDFQQKMTELSDSVEKESCERIITEYNEIMSEYKKQLSDVRIRIKEYILNIKNINPEEDTTNDKNSTLDRGNTKFIWTKDKEDPDLYKYGSTFLWVVGRSSAIQKFVEAVSYKIGYKCDFALTGGRAHIDVSKEGYKRAIKVLEDSEFMNQFIVPYSEESYKNGTYFEII